VQALLARYRSAAQAMQVVAVVRHCRQVGSQLVQVPAFENWLVTAQWVGSKIELQDPLARVRFE
jgi:hypothetical protein